MDYTFQNIQNLIPKIAKGIMDSITQPETMMQVLIVLLCVGVGLGAGIAVKNIFRKKIKLSDKA